MSQDRQQLFLKAAVKNSLLTPAQAEEVLVSRDQRKDLGVERSVQEIAIEKGFLDEAKVEKIDSALRASLPPEQIAGFKIGEKIGKGAVGTVYKAHQLSLDKTVAVKILHQSLSRQPEFVEQFIKEARAVGKLNHPHVVGAIDAGQEDGFNYFAMEYVPGETLKNHLKRQGRLPETQIFDIARAVAQGLANAHESGLLHRDLKPDNILLGPDGVVKIGDLGLALPLDDAEVLAEEHRRMGSPYYMSPEQAAGKNIDERSDIYCLGATLYHTAVGKPPFTGSTVKEILTKHVHQKPVSPREAGADISEQAEEMILKLLEKDPDKRPQNARGVLVLLSGAEQQKANAEAAASQKRPAPKSRRGGSRPRLAAGGAASTATAAPTRKRTAAGTARSAGPPPLRSSAQVAAAAAPREREPRPLPSRRVPIMSRVLGGIGIMIAVIFVLLGLTRNSGGQNSDEARVEEEQQELVELDESRIKKRIAEWQDEIKEEAKQHRENLTTVIKNAENDKRRLAGLDNLLNNAYKSTAAIDVMQRIDAIQSLIHETEVAGAEGYFQKGQQMADSGALWRAVLYVDGMPEDELKNQKLRDRRDELLRTWEAEIDARYAADIAQFKELRARKEYKAAIAILEKVPEYADEETVKDADQFREDVEEQLEAFLASEAKKRTEEENRKYASFVNEYKRLCQQRKFLDCINKAIELDVEMTTEPIKTQLATDMAAFELLDKFIKDGLKAMMDSGKETTVKLHNKDRYTGVVVKVGPTTIDIRLKRGAGTADFPIKIEDITDETIFAIMEEVNGSKSPKYLIPLGVLFTYRGQLDVAKQHFNLLEGTGISPQQWLDKLEWMKMNSGS